MSAGYSGTPLIKKLGIKAGQRVALIHAPAHYRELLGELPSPLTLSDEQMDHLRMGIDLIQFFVTNAMDLTAGFPILKRSIFPHGAVWISWPKTLTRKPMAAALVQMATDLNENRVREIGLAAGLVDVKVCAVDAIWSGLKFVVRVVDRKVIDTV